MTKLLLIRHGETFDNVNRIMQGQTQGELNAKGIEQAHETAEKLAKCHIDVFLSSDLKRSSDTCEIIAKPHNGKVITTPLLRERDWGGFTRRYIPDIKNEKWPDDVEPLDTLIDRAGKFIEYVRKNYSGKTVLAVGHGIINKAIQAYYFKKEMKDIIRMENAEIRVLEL